MEDRARVARFTNEINEKLGTRYVGFHITEAEYQIVAGTNYEYKLIPTDVLGVIVTVVIYRNLQG